jgi:hypothetical protein
MTEKIKNIIDKHIALLIHKKFEESNRLLKRTRIKTTKTEELITHLQSTVKFKDNLQYYKTFYIESIKHMKRRKEYSDEIMKGLEIE